MKALHTFTVVPTLPPALERLRELAFNLRWSWDYDTRDLFRDLDHGLWEATEQNPVAMLRRVDQDRLDRAAADEGYVSRLDDVYRDYQQYMTAESTWFDINHEVSERPLVAYFSAEFGLAECLSIFAGGLGVLAGDHLKSASDLGIPLVGVGLMYQRGYFRQYLDDSGYQQERFWFNDFNLLPLTLERGPDGSPVVVTVPFPGRDVRARIWRVQVGRVTAYLLDTNLHDNQPADREITSRLYGGGSDMRIKQEIMLGIGGYRALAAVGIEPTVYHLNEGHASFLVLERIRDMMAHTAATFAEAREITAASTVFTSHTPVAAGHDRFEPSMIEHYFAGYWETFNVSREEFLGLGRENPFNDAEYFTMTVLALRLASYRNGVSRLHGEITREMWQGIWRGLPADEIPISHVTNGVHLPTWVSREMGTLYDNYLGSHWRDEPGERARWDGIYSIPLPELWDTHQHLRQRLVMFARDRVRQQLKRRGVTRSDLAMVDGVLDPNALTVGFARRFATYKRATLLLRDLDRLDRIVNDPDRPVQFIFAGKAHPHDEGGKELVHQIASLRNDPRFRGRLVFLEDYDMAIARSMVQGVDVWLNTPRRPWEASGTSGMKTVANGGLNLSILDGWWDEAWQADRDTGDAPIGWVIGDGITYEDAGYGDQADAESLYALLEQQVAPEFYNRDEDNIPRQWMARVQASLRSLCWFFNTHRMLQEYTESYYLPARTQYQRVARDNMREGRELVAWRDTLSSHWSDIRITAADQPDSEQVTAGSQVTACAYVHLGEIAPENVDVQIYLGSVDDCGNLTETDTRSMRLASEQEDGWLRYEAEQIPTRDSGHFGYTFRVIPRHDGLPSAYLPGLVTWADQSE